MNNFELYNFHGSPGSVMESEQQDKDLCIINPLVCCVMKTELSITILTYRLIQLCY